MRYDLDQHISHPGCWGEPWVLSPGWERGWHLPPSLTEGPWCWFRYQSIGAPQGPAVSEAVPIFRHVALGLAALRRLSCQGRPHPQTGSQPAQHSANPRHVPHAGLQQPAPGKAEGFHMDMVGAGTRSGSQLCWCRCCFLRALCLLPAEPRPPRPTHPRQQCCCEHIAKWPWCRKHQRSTWCSFGQC